MSREDRQKSRFVKRTLAVLAQVQLHLVTVEDSFLQPAKQG